MDIHAVIGKLPRPKGGFTLPNHKYTGPYNPLDKQLDAYDQPRVGQEPYNAVDAIAMRNNIYVIEITVADKENMSVMIKCLKNLMRCSRKEIVKHLIGNWFVHS